MFLDVNFKCGENNGILVEILDYNSNNFVFINLWVVFVSLFKLYKRFIVIIGGFLLVIIFYDEIFFFLKW